MLNGIYMCHHLILDLLMITIDELNRVDLSFCINDCQ
jgi:hypothetical protein